jgi:hypothetical protein
MSLSTFGIADAPMLIPHKVVNTEQSAPLHNSKPKTKSQYLSIFGNLAEQIKSSSTFNNPNLRVSNQEDPTIKYFDQLLKSIDVSPKVRSQLLAYRQQGFTIKSCQLKDRVITELVISQKGNDCYLTATINEGTVIGIRPRQLILLDHITSMSFITKLIDLGKEQIQWLENQAIRGIQLNEIDLSAVSSTSSVRNGEGGVFSFVDSKIDVAYTLDSTPPLNHNEFNQGFHLSKLAAHDTSDKKVIASQEFSQYLNHITGITGVFPKSLCDDKQRLNPLLTIREFQASYKHGDYDEVVITVDFDKQPLFLKLVNRAKSINKLQADFLQTKPPRFTVDEICLEGKASELSSQKLALLLSNYGYTANSAVRLVFDELVKHKIYPQDVIHITEGASFTTQDYWAAYTYGTQAPSQSNQTPAIVIRQLTPAKPHTKIDASTVLNNLYFSKDQRLMLDIVSLLDLAVLHLTEKNISLSERDKSIININFFDNSIQDIHSTVGVSPKTITALAPLTKLQPCLDHLIDKQLQIIRYLSPTTKEYNKDKQILWAVSPQHLLKAFNFKNDGGFEEIVLPQNSERLYLEHTMSPQALHDEVYDIASIKEAKMFGTNILANKTDIATDFEYLNNYIQQANNGKPLNYLVVTIHGLSDGSITDNNGHDAMIVDYVQQLISTEKMGRPILGKGGTLLLTACSVMKDPAIRKKLSEIATAGKLTIMGGEEIQFMGDPFIKDGHIIGPDGVDKYIGNLNAVTQKAITPEELLESIKSGHTSFENEFSTKPPIKTPKH